GPQRIELFSWLVPPQTTWRRVFRSLGFAPVQGTNHRSLQTPRSRFLYGRSENSRNSGEKGGFLEFCGDGEASPMRAVWYAPRLFRCALLRCPTIRSEKNAVVATFLIDVVQTQLCPIELRLKLSQRRSTDLLVDLRREEQFVVRELTRKSLDHLTYRR